MLFLVYITVWFLHTSAWSLKSYLTLIQHNPEKRNLKIASTARRRGYLGLQRHSRKPLIFIPWDWAGMRTLCL